MSSVELSQHALAAHNKKLHSVRDTEPDKRRDTRRRERPKNPQIQQVIQDNKSMRSGGSKKSDSGSGRSAPQSLMSVLRIRKRLSKWKGSKISTVSMNRQILLENTFKMEPDNEMAFNSHRTKAAIEEVLCHHLDPLDGYNRERTVPLARLIADDIKIRVKALGFSRFKIVAHVVIGENTGQGLEVASRGVWDTDTDRMIPVTYQKRNLFALATVFGMYFE